MKGKIPRPRFRRHLGEANKTVYGGGKPKQFNAPPVQTTSGSAAFPVGPGGEAFPGGSPDMIGGGADTGNAGL